MRLFYLIWTFVRALFVRRTNLAMEDLALRQQLTVLSQKATRPLFNVDGFGSEGTDNRVEQHWQCHAAGLAQIQHG